MPPNPTVEAEGYKDKPEHRVVDEREPGALIPGRTRRDHPDGRREEEAEQQPKQTSLAPHGCPERTYRDWPDQSSDDERTGDKTGQ